MSAEPAVDAMVNASPTFLRLYFDKRPIADNSEIVLRGADGASRPLRGIHHMGANDLMISVSESLPAGNYVVECRADFPGADSPVTGSYKFSVAVGR